MSKFAPIKVKLFGRTSLSCTLADFYSLVPELVNIYFLDFQRLLSNISDDDMKGVFVLCQDSVITKFCCGSISISDWFKSK